MGGDGKRLIMVPGPTNVSDRVMRAMARPIVNHRGEEFTTFMRGLTEKAKKLFQTEQEVVILSASGTGAVEAAVWNIIRPGDKAIVVVAGEFGERLAEAIESAGGHVVKVKSEYGQVPSLKSIEDEMNVQGTFKALYLVHNETGTGVALPYVEEASRMAREHGAFVVVDAVSSLGGYAIPFDRWGIDACVTASQKCIAAPPGLSLFAASRRLLDYLKTSPPATKYFDLTKCVQFAARGETPFTPAMPLFFALDEALGELMEEGLAERVKRHERVSSALYDGMAPLGLKPFAAEGVRSRTVIAAVYPEGIDDAQFRKTLDKEHDIVVGAGFGPLKGKVFRIGCMGLVSDADASRVLRAMAETMKSPAVRAAPKTQSL